MQALDLNSEDEQILYLVKTDVDQAKCFFARAKSLRWFFPLNRLGFFSIDKIKFDEHENAIFWNVLDYLERISKQVTDNQQLQYGEELLKIINGIIQFSQEEKRINNIHIWWYCLKIINNLPFSIIKKELDIAKFSIWLSVILEHSANSMLALSFISEKFLPKFLQDEAAIDDKYIYAETIIELITRITVKKKNKFQDGFALAGDSLWVQDAFYKNYRLIERKCSINVMFNLADKLKKALAYKTRSSRNILTINNVAYRIVVTRQFDLKNDDMFFIEGNYNCEVKQYSLEQLKELDIKNEYSFYNVEPLGESQCFSFSATNKGTFVSKIKEALPNLICAERFDLKIGSIFDSFYSDYLYVMFKSLHDADFKPSEYIPDEETFMLILRDILLAKCEANPQEGRLVLDKFLTEQYQFPIFRRLALLCIDKYWNDYSILLDKFFELQKNALTKEDFEVELHDVFYRHNEDFKSLKTDFQKLIQDVPELYAENEKWKVHWQYKWLSPLRDNPDFSQWYNEIEMKVEAKKPYEPQRSTFTTSWGNEQSTFKMDFSQKTVAEIVQYLKEFKLPNGISGIAISDKSTFAYDPSKEEFANALQADVRNNPGKFTDELGAFSNVDYPYIHAILRGFKEAWSNKKMLDWENIFNFVLKYYQRDKKFILNEALEAQGEDSGDGKYIWIIDDTVDLISDGCRDDKNAFDKKYFSKVEQIFTLISPLLKGAEQLGKNRDALMFVMNTTLGRAIMSYINFSLRIARATQKKEINWGKEKYEPYLSKGIEAIILLGLYLPQIRYLDKNYAENNINLFAKKSIRDIEWQGFMQGYLDCPNFHPGLYQLMYQHYLQALDSSNFEEYAEKRLVEHACFGYLQVDAAINNSLLWKMLMVAEASGKQGARWLKVGNSLPLIAQNLINVCSICKKEDVANKILEFWKWIYLNCTTIEKKLGKDYGAFLESIFECTYFLIGGVIDKEKAEWLLLCAAHIHQTYTAYSLIKYFTKFSDAESIKHIGEIFIKILANITPAIDQNDIAQLVENIYKAQCKNYADEICNTYIRRGVYFLRPIYEKYNGKN